MDERRSLLSYIWPSPWLALVCVLLLAATLLCAFYTPPAVEIDPVYPPLIPVGSPAFVDSETEGELCSLPAIAVSDAICQGEDGKLFYAIEDQEHYFRIASVSGETYALMGAQRALWNDPGSAEEPIVLTGRRTQIPDEVKAGFLEVFSMEEEVFDAYFGGLCLVEEDAVVPDGGRSAAWTVFAVIFVLGFFAVFPLWIGCALASWSALVRLEEREQLSEAARQLNSPDAKAEQDNVLCLTKDFLFGRRCGLAAAWNDVVWSYERSIGVGSLVLCRALVICTADGKSHPLFFSSKEAKELRRLANRLCEKNPDMLWDLTEENRAAWKERST